MLGPNSDFAIRRHKEKDAVKARYRGEVLKPARKGVSLNS
jgi:hypothetical protein